jgi:hypothetical protein
MNHGKVTGTFMTDSGDAVCYFDGCVDMPGIGVVDGPHRTAELPRRSTVDGPARPEPQHTMQVSICVSCYAGKCGNCCIYGWTDAKQALLVNCHCSRIGHPVEMGRSGLSADQYDVHGRVVN